MARLALVVFSVLVVCTGGQLNDGGGTTSEEQQQQQPSSSSPSPSVTDRPRLIPGGIASVLDRFSFLTNHSQSGASSEQYISALIATLNSSRTRVPNPGDSFRSLTDQSVRRVVTTTPLTFNADAATRVSGGASFHATTDNPADAETDATATTPRTFNWFRLTTDNPGSEATTRINSRPFNPFDFTTQRPVTIEVTTRISSRPFDLFRVPTPGPATPETTTGINSRPFVPFAFTTPGPVSPDLTNSRGSATSHNSEPAVTERTGSPSDSDNLLTTSSPLVAVTSTTPTDASNPAPPAPPNNNNNHNNDVTSTNQAGTNHQESTTANSSGSVVTNHNEATNANHTGASNANHSTGANSTGASPNSTSGRGGDRPNGAMWPNNPGRPGAREGFPLVSQEEFDNAVREALTRWRWRMRYFRIKTFKCSMGNACILELQRQIPVPKYSDEIEIESDEGLCSEEPLPAVADCCQRMVKAIHDNMEARRGAAAARVLRQADCKTLYCSDTRCKYIGCEVPDKCEVPETSSVTRDTGTGSGGTTSDPASLTGDDEVGSSRVTVIVVACLFTFLAGLGGAVLVTCLWKRRKDSKDSGGRSDDSTRSSAAFVSGKGDEENFYEQLTNTGRAKGARKQELEARSSSGGENEYTYIGEGGGAGGQYATPGDPAPPAPRAPHSPQAYSVPGDHLAVHRRLPVAPLPPAYSLAVEDAQPPAQRESKRYFELEKGGAGGDETSFSKPRASKQYFELETPDTPSASGPPPPPPRKEREPLPVPPPPDNSGEAYSALYESEAGRDVGEYTALENNDSPPDYLELIADYSLQKPVG